MRSRAKVIGLIGNWLRKFSRRSVTKIDRFDQEVAAPHCRIENLEIEQSFDQVIMGRIGFGRSPLAMIHLAAADLLGGVCFRFLPSLSKVLRT